ncbi:DUF397 domain-containing protein [Nocardia terpenica]|uniref:DUF397 domain-containing protein n=1 Tax=Nocardia terpenica TaxID=455432 RepID=UPI001893EDBF|nr:DUF397 domain-containing protein [Nocardia terpenica]MBF6062999.1 DUF397 domain-containing protein [Nocardia terpenica]MBF6104866.1 DUF397 domain-containing protein [Nocardia terpenica]MBF6112697.1 DUF397 domain-containing protein [Nocardia terpenica]MBF6118594.1 DUF397 domain-containing protein [Nocardia terpenica]MBF6155073.1 DUF397 domain-containing protein [Nocardia terpenica]
MSATQPSTCVNDGFFKSSFSNDGTACVEVKFVGDRVLIRDSKYTGPADQQPVLSLPSVQWPALLDLTLSRESGHAGFVTISVHPDGGATITGQDTALVYTPAEWDAFAKGVADGQFNRTV